MKTSFSVVLPIHDEEDLLPYSLPSILRLNPTELILIFDRCTDGSVQLALNIVKAHNYSGKTRTMLISKKFKSRIFQLAGVRRRGYALAKNNIILSTGADIILDSEMNCSRTILEDNRIALISLGCMDYPVSPRNLIGNLVSHIMNKLGHPRFYGPFLFKRDKYLEVSETEEIGIISEDAPLWLALLEKYEMKVLPAKCLHLRQDETRSRNYARGRDYWRVAKRNVLFAFASSLLMLRPSLMVGYIHERLKQ